MHNYSSNMQNINPPRYLEKGNEQHHTVEQQKTSSGDIRIDLFEEKRKRELINDEIRTLFIEYTKMWKNANSTTEKENIMIIISNLTKMMKTVP